jgi:PTH1 family peptidyl-tRNA hydrolase
LAEPEGIAILLGLGNPGPEYARTRHNLGFMVVDELARRHGVAVKERSRLALTGRGQVAGHEVLLAKPRTYMNLSGQAAVSLLATLRLPPRCMLVLVDDFNLPLGRLRLRRSGSPGGHNGLASITQALGTQDFPRLRLGIGPVPAGVDVVDWVLEEFYPDERQAVRDMIERAADCVECLLREGFEAAAQRFNPDPRAADTAPRPQVPGPGGPAQKPGDR